MKKPKQEVFTSNHSNAKIEMHDRSAKRSEHHGGADHDPADHHNWSAPIAVDENAADGSCTEEREKLFTGPFFHWRVTGHIHHWPPAYIDASMTEDTQAIWL